MKSEVNLEIYRVALESANSELTEISAEVERLRTRKDQIESLIVVLRPLVDEEVAAFSDIQAESSTHEQIEAAEENPTEEEDRQPEPVTADPFQRRIDHVLGIGAGIRDVRKYSRQF